MGARAEGMGYASACLEDSWSTFNNIGGVAKVTQVSAAFTHHQVAGMPFFKRTAFAVALPTRWGTAGVGAFRFGDDLYNEQLFTAGFSNTFGIASLGVRLNYIQYRIEGLGSKGVFSLNLGGITHLTSKLSIAAQITNLLQPDLSVDDEKLPTILTTGVLFKPTPNLLLSSEVEKDLSYPLKLKSGMEYTLYKKFIFRTGFSLQPDTGSIGLGFKPGSFTFDYAYSYAFDLGASHQATVGYAFKSKSQ
jgi:hypothetical protein